MPADPPLTNLVGIDYGKPGGDMTAITARCPKCQRVYTITYEPSPIAVVPIELQCRCGEVTSLRGVVRTGSEAHPRAGADHDLPALWAYALRMHMRI